MSRRATAALVLGCLAAAALSLLGPRALAFDPQAWVVWGRDALTGSLSTAAGPSWKPLPVLITTPFALAGDAAAELWLVVARGGGLLALAGAARLGSVLAGPAAAAGAAAVLAFSPWWAYNSLLGNSEGLLVAAVLWAAVAHRERHFAIACLLGLAASLLRPEAWPFLIGYGLWIWRQDPSARPFVIAAAVLVPVLWLGPDLIGAGGALQASGAALSTPTGESAQLAPLPALAVVEDVGVLLTLPALLAAVLGVVSGGHWERGLAAGAVGWVAIVAVMTQAGYAGNPRYLVAAASIGCVLAGIGVARLSRWRWAALGALTALVAVFSGGGALERLGEVGERETLRRGLDTVIARGGGATSLRACGTPRTSAAKRAIVAWRLEVSMLDLDEPPTVPGILLRAPLAGRTRVQPDLPPAARRSLRLVARAGGWELWSSCAAAQVGGAKRTVMRSNPSARIRPSSILRVLSSARRRRAVSARAASASLASARL